VRWRVLVPIKHGAPAKTRLRGASKDLAAHGELVRAIQLDTLDAVLALGTHPLLAGVVVVSDPAATRLPTEIESLPDAGGGLNRALATAAATLAARYPGDGVVAMVGDLPALRPADLLTVLHQLRPTGRGFVRDCQGTGTTLLATATGADLQPGFGPDSAERHLRSGARELDAPASVRCDVDTEADLRRCLALGVGVLTSELLVDLV
jgi:2-phospho-L-lactate guanylyltransferase